MNLKQAFASRRFKYGTVSTAISIIFIALIVVINVVASVLVDKFPLTVDLTPNSMFKLSGESIEFIKGIEKPVEIYVLVDEKDLTTGGNLYTSQIKSVIDQYAQYNHNISVSYVDIVTDPTFASNYPDIKLSYNDVLIISGDRHRKIAMVDMFNVNYNQYTGQQTVQSSSAEEMMTGAIMFVTSEDNVKVAFTTGHDELESEALTTLLENNNFEISTINLTTEDIPSDVDMVFMLSPVRDPDEAVLEKLDAYLENGEEFGKSFFYAASADQTDMPNINAFLADWGISVDPGMVVETDTANVFNYNSAFCTVEFTSDEFTDDITTSIRPSMPYGKPLSVLYDAQSGRETTVLLSYADSACVQPIDAGSDWQPAESDKHSIPALVKSMYVRYDNNTPLISSVFVASSVLSFDSMLLNSKSFTNADYYLNLFNTVMERDDVISIAPKSLGGKQLGITQAQVNMISIVLVYVLPIMTIAAGLIIWLRRRHK